MNFLTGEDVLLEKDLLEKVATIKRFKYLSLGTWLRRQIDIARKQYQGFDKAYEFDKKRDDKRKKN